ncbi:G8 domain-containing protein [Nitrosomonas aestuarii]|uniref:G8 domain-containing protein n=1 Tax=Nitrosomonas aestuarii TaxID=52441 RepID=UPI000D310023|nr:G8 domain-containing protein [Nitrosomonas aestuarii]PTN11872.1 G8 domain-containing protein [Nitrosomonas aestuarii]
MKEFLLAMIIFVAASLVFAEEAPDATSKETAPLESVEPHHHPAAVMEGDLDSVVTGKDVIPNFAAHPTIVSKQSGNWFDVSTWQQARVPHADDVVRIEQGHAVNYNGISDAALASLGIKGTLTFDTAMSSRIKVGTILVYREGRMNVGTLASPIAGNVKVEIIIANRSLATWGPDRATGAYDPLQYGTGLISFGEVNMHGKEMSPTWIRLAQEPRAGQNTLVLASSPTGWSVGDKLVLPDTRQTPLVKKWQIEPVTPIELQLEEMIIADISGNTIRLTRPLVYDHLGGRDTDGNLIGMPHIGNLSRNIVVRSENSGGVRGHSMFTERSKVDIRYVSFVDMGRTTAKPLDNTVITDNVVAHIGTNQIGRYPIHMHHHMGPVNTSNDGYQFVLVGNAIDNGAKWGIAVHNSHFGLVDGNVVYDVEGAGIITEEGNERENVFSNNFVVKVGTIIKSLYEPRYGGVAEIGRHHGFSDFGYEGSALWFTGNDDYVTGNVAANAAYAGVMYNARSKGFVNNQPLVPNFRGADIDDLTQWTSYKKTFAPEIRMSRNNEVYASGVGIWVGFAGVVGQLSDYLLWNIKQTGLYSQRNISAAYDNITIIGNQAVSNKNYIGTINIGIDLHNPRYQAGHVVLRNIRVEGFNLGIDLPAFLLPVEPQFGLAPPRITIVDDAFLRNYVNVREHSPLVGSKYTLLKDVEFEQNMGPQNKFLSLKPAAIATRIVPPFSLSTVTELSRTYVYNYDKQSGNDFQLFFKEQSPGHVMVAREYPAGNLLANQNCPTVGLTNQQCWDQFGVANLKDVAPCKDTSRIEIDGFTCPISDAATLEELLSLIPEI